MTVRAEHQCSEGYLGCDTHSKTNAELIFPAPQRDVKSTRHFARWGDTLLPSRGINLLPSQSQINLCRKKTGIMPPSKKNVYIHMTFFI